MISILAVSSVVLLSLALWRGQLGLRAELPGVVVDSSEVSPKRARKLAWGRRTRQPKVALPCNFAGTVAIIQQECEL